MMETGGDYKKEWFAQSQINYFTAFITLWLSCNSWYNFHYSLAKDRDHINKIKEDSTSTNKLFCEFKNLVSQSNTKEQKIFFANIEQLYYSLNRNRISGDRLLFPLSFEKVLPDYSRKDEASAYESIVIQNARTRTRKLRSGVSGIDLGEIVLIDDQQKVFAGIFEIIYQVRCQLVHGNLNPTEENLDTVKYCYFILYDLLKPFCG
ncbi:MAG: hypothetical protein J6T70_07135 [Bacteroidales bacterium]|nr:hypothetical protein [Bacteroidales bacterium]